MDAADKGRSRGMSWIKVENATPNKPEVLKLARLLGVSRDDAFGKAMRFWIWLDGVTVDGRVDGVTSTDVDAVVGAVGVADALIAAGWLSISEDQQSIVVPNFDRHNGESAKKRAQKTQRQAKWRAKHVDAHVDATVSTAASTREDKKRDNTPIVPKGTNGYCRSFEDWWNAYPKKAGKDAAFKAWKKAGAKIKAAMVCSSDEAAAYLLKVAIEYAVARADQDPQFTLNPATWLNQGRWNDDRATWRKLDAKQSSRDEPPTVPAPDSDEVRRLYPPSPDWSKM
jgi:hypothetical protein